MIVEDEGVVALELEECLRQLGYTVAAVASTGAEAMARAADIRPDLVLMDVRLKGEMDGIEAARQIMGGHGIPVVYLTAHSDDATVQRARETAPFGYVLKPWEEKSLQIAIELALHKARAEADIRNERDWYLSILRYTGAPMLVCAADGTVRFLNASAEQLLGAAARGAVGRPLEQVVDLRQRSGSAPLGSSLLRNATAREREATRSLFLSTGAGDLPVEVATVPVIGESGTDLGFLVVMRPRPAGEAPVRGRRRRTRPMSLDEYLQTELIRLLVFQEQSGQDSDRFVEGQLEAYRRLMRDFLGRDALQSGQTDWKEGLVRRAVRDAHEQTKAVLLGRPDIVEGGQLVPAKLTRYLEVLCARLASSSSARLENQNARVEVREINLDVDVAIYCVLLVNEIVQSALSSAESRSVAILLGAGEPGFGKLVVTVDPGTGDSPPPVSSVMAALVSELDASLSVTSDSRTAWTITFPLVGSTPPQRLP